MDLILWRHAEAENGTPDLDRALTLHGREQARKVARWLLKHLPEDAAILASPACRTQQTVAALGRIYTTLHTIAPGAHPQALLDAAGWPTRGGTVLIVGHQPSLGEAAALLLTGRSAAIPVKKGAVWWFSGTDFVEYGECTLRAAITPGMLL